MSVYTCLFSKVTQVGKPTIYSSLVGVKGFLQSKDSTGPFGKNVTIVNNPGQHVYPGGAGDKTKISEALREFKEETGIAFVESAQGKVTYDKYTFPVYLEQSTYYSCAYIRTNTPQDLVDLQATITANIKAATTISDELNRVDIIPLADYVQQDANDAIKKYCFDNYGNLTYTGNYCEWRDYLRDKRMPWPNPTPTTKDKIGGKAATGVKEFLYDSWNMGPFMNFITYPPPGTPFFDFPNGQFYFMKKNESLPGRFATDWFSNISEKIIEVDLKM